MLLFILILVLFVAFYLYGIRTFDYWKKKGIKHDKTVPYFGTNFKQFTQQASMAMMATETYNKYPNEKVVGFYRGTTPELVIRDPAIAKRILVSDFQNFYGRGFNPHKIVIEPLMKNIFFADGDLWKLVRQRFTPAFSTAKLKAMFPLITDRAEKLQVMIEDLTKIDHYDARELMARYTTEFIGACGFGINMDTIDDENSMFRKLGKRIFHRTFMDGVRGGLKYIFPELCKHVKFLDDEIDKSMTHLVRSVLNERGNEPSGKNDFIDLLLELKKKGKMVGESIETKNPDGSVKIVEHELNEGILTAQVFAFFGAGYETSSAVSSYTLHQLAFNPDYQEKIQEEIDEVLARHGNKITYDAVKDMTYLEMAFYESMRMHPSLGYLIRMCEVPEYTIPEINLTINEGVKVIIPIQAIHRDPQYFENPKKFDPYRFKDGAVKDYTRKFVYLPFGEGPRACVGERLGQMQTLAGIAAVLQKFTVEPAACSVLDPPPVLSAIVAEGFANGLPIKIRKRSEKKK